MLSLKSLRLPSSLALCLVLFGLFATSCASGSPQSTFGAEGDVSRQQLNLFYIIFWAAVVVFVGVEGLLIIAVLRFRRKAGQGIPEQVHGNSRLEIIWTLVPAIVLAVIAVPTIITIVRLDNPPPQERGENGLNVTVVAHQWWWEFEYPDLGIKTANELYIPVGRDINLTLKSADVIHSFWVPKLAGKKDVIPNYPNTLWIEADTEGIYFGQCAEFCGIAHAQMRFRVIAVSEQDFEKWATDFLRPSVEPVGLGQQGAQLFTSKGCVACHTITDNPVARGISGPDLTQFGTRVTVGAGILDNDKFGENLTKWLANPGAVKQGNLMAKDAPVYNDPNMALTNKDVAALVLYLNGLVPDETKPPRKGGEPVPTPIVGPVPEPGPGNAQAGQQVFTSQGCAGCHSTGTSASVGPGLGGISGRAGTMVSGLSAGQYLYQSIVDPGAFLVSGFGNLMPKMYGQSLSKQQIDDLIAYLMSLQ